MTFIHYTQYQFLNMLILNKVLTNAKWDKMNIIQILDITGK